MNLLGLMAVISASVFAGFCLRSRQIKNQRLKVVHLEKEMINNHAEILELQLEYLNMEAKWKKEKQISSLTLQTTVSPVNEKSPDVSGIKKSVKKEIFSSLPGTYQLNYSNVQNNEAQVQY